MMALLNFLTNTSPIYDPSKNQLIIGGYVVQGLTQASVDNYEFRSVEKGIDPTHLLVKQTHVPDRVITFSVLYTSPSYVKLKQLINYTKRKFGFFEMIIVKNGEIEIQTPAWFISTPSFSMEEEDVDPTFKIGFYNATTRLEHIETETAPVQDPFPEIPPPSALPLPT